MKTNKPHIVFNSSTEVKSKNKPLSNSHTAIKLKTISKKERENLRIPSYQYLLPWTGNLDIINQDL